MSKSPSSRVLTLGRLAALVLAMLLLLTHAQAEPIPQALTAGAAPLRQATRSSIINRAKELQLRDGPGLGHGRRQNGVTSPVPNPPVLCGDITAGVPFRIFVNQTPRTDLLFKFIVANIDLRASSSTSAGGTLFRFTRTCSLQLVSNDAVNFVGGDPTQDSRILPDVLGDQPVEFALLTCSASRIAGVPFSDPTLSCTTGILGDSRVLRIGTTGDSVLLAIPGGMSESATYSIQL